MMIPITSIFIGLMIVLIPFMLVFFLIKFLNKGQNKSLDLELRLQLLEEEIRQIKRQIEFIDEIWCTYNYIAKLRSSLTKSLRKDSLWKNYTTKLFFTKKAYKLRYYNLILIEKVFYNLI